MDVHRRYRCLESAYVLYNENFESPIRSSDGPTNLISSFLLLDPPRPATPRHPWQAGRKRRKKEREKKVSRTPTGANATLEVSRGTLLVLQVPYCTPCLTMAYSNAVVARKHFCHSIPIIESRYMKRTQYGKTLGWGKLIGKKRNKNTRYGTKRKTFRNKALKDTKATTKYEE
ncbi:hypothetical protein L873DRAFT_489883 [Choiromyces venosus 120613-1]|uniref:Uncharacterized protein n=1 Tax=Choiromyces venosus 120613-1 TaxID=1336337 RepID=A0A3N4JUX0_9PEZI|nr:hypothetical protein L873DRAFT_489883 [Choiromyces venosus 120613-1]